MKSLINLSPIFNFLKKKDEKSKEPTFTLSEVIAIFDEALMRADDGIGCINWDDIEYDLEIDWDKTMTEQGISSMIILLIKRDLEKKKTVKIKTEMLFKYPTLNKFCEYMEGRESN